MASRWFVVPVALATAIGLWNAYVVLHAHGSVEGRVVDAAGRPVAGATVVLLERSFVTHSEKARTTSSAGGLFRFDDNRNHSLQLEAEATGAGKSERLDVRLWFRAQDVRLVEPLRLPGRVP